MSRFAKALQIPQAQAIGTMELLWHFTAKYAIQGNIGRYSNEEIAEAVLWPGDPTSLIAALVFARWVDLDNAHRLVIHDWAEHCDESVKKTLKNRGLVPVKATFEKVLEVSSSLTEFSACLSLCRSLAVALPKPCQLPPAPSAKKPTPLPPDGGGFVEFWLAYPKKVGKKAAETAWKKAKDRPALEVILSAIQAQRESDQWTKDGGQFIPNPATWLNQGRWADEVFLGSGKDAAKSREAVALAAQAAARDALARAFAGVNEGDAAAGPEGTGVVGRVGNTEMTIKVSGYGCVVIEDLATFRRWRFGGAA